jgi:hypothetical protein
MNQGLTNLKKTDALSGSIGKENAFVELEPATANQFAPSPVFALLV